eukprot:345873-Chlamydomonas_euryale.AAC.2
MPRAPVRAAGQGPWVTAAVPPGRAYRTEACGPGGAGAAGCYCAGEWGHPPEDAGAAGEWAATAL